MKGRSVTFGDVVENVTLAVADPAAAGIARSVGLDDLDPGSLRVQRWADVAHGTTFTRRFFAGQVLFGKRRAYQRKAAVPDFDGVCSGDILVFQATGALNRRLLPFIVQSDAFVDHALATSAGSLSPRTKWSELRKFPLLLPDAEEQAHLANMFEAATEVVYKAQAIAAAAQDAINATVDELLGSRAWPILACEELLIAGPQNWVSPPANSEGRGYPTLSIAAVQEGRVVVEGQTKWAEVERCDVEPFMLKQNDILVVRGNGNRDFTGRCGLVDEVPADCFYPDLLIRLVFDGSRMRPEFAVLQWNGPLVQRQLMTRAKSTNGIWKVNGKDIKQQQLSVPPLTQQDEVLERARALMALRDLAKRRAVDTRSLLLALVADRLFMSGVH